MCQNRSMSGTSKNVRIRSVSYVTVWFRTDCDEKHVTACRQMAKGRLQLVRVMLGLFTRSEELHPSRVAAPVGSPMIQFVSFER